AVPVRPGAVGAPARSPDGDAVSWLGYRLSHLFSSTTCGVIAPVSARIKKTGALLESGQRHRGGSRFAQSSRSRATTASMPRLAGGDGWVASPVFSRMLPGSVSNDSPAPSYGRF